MMKEQKTVSVEFASLFAEMTNSYVDISEVSLAESRRRIMYYTNKIEADNKVSVQNLTTMEFTV